MNDLLQEASSMSIALAAGVCALSLVAINLTSMALAGRRWLGKPPGHASTDRPAISIVRPLFGLEPFSQETIEASFFIDWPDYEIIFCVQRPTDPIIPLVEHAIAAHPGVQARLLIGDEPISANPKLNNCVKGWNAARHDFVVLVDSNSLTPTDYLERLMGEMRPGVGMVVSMPLGVRPASFFAEVECAVLNTYQARWQYAAAAVGMGFAQGKNMLWRRDVLERAGGIGALAAEIAEDAASTKILRAQKMAIRLVDRPFEQPLGRRTWREVWSRHARWARLRRVTFPLHFAPEILSGALLPMVLAAFAAREFGHSAWIGAAVVATLLYGAELALAILARFPTSWRTLIALPLRDLCLPIIWFDAWLFDDFTWHGQQISLRDDAKSTREDFA